VGFAKRPLDSFRALPAREDETQVARALRQGQEFLSFLGRDDDFLNIWNSRGRLDACHTLVDAAFGNRDHHDAASRVREYGAGDVLAHRVPQDQFFE